MATKEDAATQAFAPVLAALSTMQGNVSRQEKTHAHEFLEGFQKSVSFPFRSAALLPTPPLIAAL